jgi:hypothetical protein
MDARRAGPTSGSQPCKAQWTLIAINSHYLSNDDRSAMDSYHTGATYNDNSSVDCCLFSDNNNIFATFLDLPLSVCKKKATERNIERREKPAKKKRETTVALDSDSNKTDTPTPPWPWPLPKVLKSPWFFPPTLSDGTCQWMVLEVIEVRSRPSAVSLLITPSEDL